jgi:hypothetical protein
MLRQPSATVIFGICIVFHADVMQGQWKGDSFDMHTKSLFHDQALPCQMNFSYPAYIADCPAWIVLGGVHPISIDE